MTIHWKAVEQYFTVVLSVCFQFSSVGNFGIIGLNLPLSGVKELIQLSFSSKYCGIVLSPMNGVTWDTVKVIISTPDGYIWSLHLVISQLL